MAVHYSLPERRKHHEEIVKRLISNPTARNKSNTYIYRLEHEEKERIVDILNQWDNESYSTAPSSQVINKEAVPSIKEWCSNSSGKDLVSVKKFLQHLTNEQSKEEEASLGGENTQRGRMGSRRNSLLLSDRNGRPSLQKRDTITNGSFYPDPFEGRGNSTGMFNIVKSVPQPNLKIKSATGKRPTTSGSQASVSSARKMSGMKRTTTQPAMSRRNTEYFEIPTNRSGVFGEVIKPPPQQQQKENQPPQPQSPPANKNSKRAPSSTNGKRGQWNRPSTMQSRPGTTQSRPGTMQSRPGTMVSQRSRIPVGLGRRTKTQGNMVRNHESPAEKLKFSANLQNAREEELNEPAPRNGAPIYVDDGVTPRYPQQHQQQQQQQYQPQQQQQQHYHNQQQHYQQQQQPEHHQYQIDISPPPTGGEYLEDGESSHRPIQYPNKFPGRKYQPSQIFW